MDQRPRGGEKRADGTHTGADATRRVYPSRRGRFEGEGFAADSVPSYLSAVVCAAVRVTRGPRRSPLPALGAVEEDPGGEVVGEVLEPVFHPGRDELHLPRPE